MSNKKSENRNKRKLTLFHRVWYQICRTSLQIFFLIAFRVCCYGRKNVPGKGAVLVVANHQSFLDPVAIGSGIFRHMNYLARKTLFKFKPFGWLIDSLDAIPLDQEGIGFAGIKETLRRLKNDEAVVIFPEGSRSIDGQIVPFREGYVTLAFRSKATIVPTVIVGSFEVYPRGKSFPSFFKRPILVEYGSPLTFEEYGTLPEKEVHELVEHQIREMFDKWMAKRQAGH